MSETARRLLGLVLGSAMGLAYGLVSQLINVLWLPGIPLYYPVPGLWGTILLLALGGGILGLITAWPSESLPGIIVSALAGAIMTTILAARSAGASPQTAVGTYTLLIITFLPRTILFTPVSGLVRWVLNIWENEIQWVTFSVKKMALSLISVLILSVLMGAFSLFPKNARYALVTTDMLIQAGRQASKTSDLPAELKPVYSFLQKAQGSYTLELSDNPDLLPVQRPVVPYYVTEYAVFVHFDNGYRFGCAYSPPHPKLSCGEY